MSFSKTLIGAAFGVSLVLGATAGVAQDQQAIKAAIKARQAVMTLNAFNLGVLGAMAKGEIEYRPAVAQAAADNLAAISGMSMGAAWPKGSDNASVEGTRALPAIWQAGSDIGAKSKALSEAIDSMQTAAGLDLESLRGAIGPLGEACGGCHKAYRQPE